jgi:endogenous inhibitor of DNA gyrase (YacG/DUF329 family)
MEKYERDCPKCGKKIYYKNKGDRQQGIKHNTQCKQCVADSRIHGKNPKKYKRKCPECGTDIFHTSEKTKRRWENQNKKCRSCASPHKGNNNFKLSESFKELYKDRRHRKKCKICGKDFITTKWDIDKIYCSKSCYFNDDSIKNHKFLPKFNKKACIFFKMLNVEKKWNGKHGLNGGEAKIMKYWVDYYEPTLNLIIEWDEQFHHHPTQIKKDKKRENEIIEHLKCDFLRINPDTLEIINIKNGKREKYEKDNWDIISILHNYSKLL